MTPEPDQPIPVQTLRQRAPRQQPSARGERSVLRVCLVFRGPSCSSHAEAEREHHGDSLQVAMYGSLSPLSPRPSADMPERLERHTSVMPEPALIPDYVQRAAHEAHEHWACGRVTICLCSRRLPKLRCYHRGGGVAARARTRSLHTSILRIRADSFMAGPGLVSRGHTARVDSEICSVDGRTRCGRHAVSIFIGDRSARALPR